MIRVLPLAVWAILAATNVAPQSQHGIGLGIKREVFFLNLEDGYFGCQVNESTEILQLYELSKLCDGVSDCFKASDELRNELKCTDDCTKEDGTRCTNGVCLNGVCHCNDGFGGCNCQEPDINECKERPCDVFAHCTNTVGSFQCSCFPGYVGNGYNCQDINECADPAIAARCVKNAECCNLPAHFICKCNRGFEGDGEEECRDIDECRHPAACGAHAICQNYPGNYTCACREGYTGNPFDGCLDIDECLQPSACGPGAICRNIAGGYECSCPTGFEGDPLRTGCRDHDECSRNPCGRDALCRNQPGAFRCECPPGYEGDPSVACVALECSAHEQCASQLACMNGRCADPCAGLNSPCTLNQQCSVHNHQPVCVKVCQCQTTADCARFSHTRCDGCSCVRDDIPKNSACDHCRPGATCDPFTGACIEKSPGTLKAPEPCVSDRDCIDTEACYMGLCQNPCEFANACGSGANCHPKKQRPMCSCPAGYDGDPAIKCSPSKPFGCTSNEECSLTEACINNACQHPCAIHDPCAQNAVCINTNHGSDCSCAEGFQGNGYVGCVPVLDYRSVCQYNEDCPPEQLCDRLNRVCMNPCRPDSCGESAECLPANHGIDCKCYAGYTGNPYLECYQVQGCRSDNECASSEACINGKCASPCRCGINAICDVLNHRASCKCLPGYTGSPSFGCEPPTNPCVPNPCGSGALCEIDHGNPICLCAKGTTGNPFQNCIPEGDDCQPNPCGPNSGCRIIDGKPACFCLPNYEGNPPRKLCKLPTNPCNPSPCGPNTQCTTLPTGYAKCTCLTGYIESPNTIRGCIEARNPCEPNPCGLGARCDPNRKPSCYCPENTIGNPYRQCSAPSTVPAIILCQPGPCGVNAECYVSSNREMCFCRTGFIGDAYSGCKPHVSDPCHPNPCGPRAICSVNYDERAVCSCAEGSTGNPASAEGCHYRECEVDDECSFDKACIGYRCRDPCPGACGINADCYADSHHPVCTCENGLIGNPLLCCLPPSDLISHCSPNPCGKNALCQDTGSEALCSCLPGLLGDPRIECHPECTTNSDCASNRACINQKCTDPCITSNICGMRAICSCTDHTVSCTCPEGFFGDPLYQCIIRPIVIPGDNLPTPPCTPNPCDPNSSCDTYGTQFTICDPCNGPDAVNNPSCRPECIITSECAFDKTCLNNRCVDPCPGSCGVNAECMVHYHDPICTCAKGFEGNPYEHCSIPIQPVEQETCNEIRCGSNAVCRDLNGALVCQCLPNFFGNPYLACRPECVINNDCSPTKACINNKCEDPCRGVCGVGALCETTNHHPICYCPPGQSGDPFIRCQPSREYLPISPCDPSPCGPYSRCLVSNSGGASCSCLPGFKGIPPMCQPECVSSSDCSQMDSCINQKCKNPCLGSCGNGAECSVINHNPICHCRPGHDGDPFVGCRPTAVITVHNRTNPCTPSPCGPNSICEVRADHPVCSCVPNYSGTPPYCRPECVISQECPSNKACINEKCRDPCSNSCGNNANCNVVNHTPFCTCVDGFRGDSYIGCTKVIVIDEPDPCNPSPCGENALCSTMNGVARCSCIPPNIGNPYSGGCRPECTINSDCPNHQSCLSNHCRDPCKGLCGTNAECTVTNHIPVCTCLPGYYGNAFSSCRREPVIPLPLNPCQPSPCGPNSQCHVSSDRAVCSCLPGYIGGPPECRPECSVSSDCPNNKACIRLKCEDPCIGSCGLNARCHVVNHNPICTCPEPLDGDPFLRCVERALPPVTPVNPCVPSPCGPQSICRSEQGRAVCSCEPGTLGAPPACRPMCVINQDCPLSLACMAGNCVDPCVGSCGFNARCNVQNHQPICSCIMGYTGDPFAGCSRAEVVHEPVHPCNPSPCGPNAVCKERNGAGSCSCLDDFFGDPYLGCRPECVMNGDCPHDRSCFNNKCVDPCPGTCGQNAECKVLNHAPSCYCFSGYNGNPLFACHPIVTTPVLSDPCRPSPCGPYSKCRSVNNNAVCSCLDACIGTPPNCRPECMISSDCALDRACINQRCEDPCPGMCGSNARCQVVNHNPICSCLVGYTGDPFIRCFEEQKPPPRQNVRPCVPSPCGPNSQCKGVNEVAVCSCERDFIGRPPNCRPECVIDSECSGNLACISERCKDPCPGSCGSFATCSVIKHIPTCTCNQGYTGDPFSGCSPVPINVPQEVSPCEGNPCGPNAVCKERHGAGSCSCLPEYYGDPYVECRPECIMNGDCPRDKACINNKCRDPCPGVCGINAECRVNNHAPSCSCLPGHEGNPFTACHLSVLREPVNPCIPSPCGPYSECRVADDHAICSCHENYIGSPPNCRPECMVSSECMQDKSCINQKCLNPCKNACGAKANCVVVNHNPLCRCPLNYVGDPFVHCQLLEEKPQPRPSGNPCVPSPCGPNSQCRVVGETAACSCLPNYIGRAPNCRPECIIDEECPSNLACEREKCRSPCDGSCGANALCVVVNHKPVCRCQDGYSGDPFRGCQFLIHVPVEEEQNPCNPSPCGPNTICKERNSAGACTCLPGYFGDPNLGCRPECVTNNDCPYERACSNNKCIDPCQGACGLNARCTVSHHTPVCLCVDGYEGDPSISCHPQRQPPREESNPCVPSPCGPYSQCKMINGHGVCSCMEGYVGSPPMCRPECVASTDCMQHEACINQKCKDPCPGTCGIHARCQVTNHNPICSCKPGFTGDPFVACQVEEKRPVPGPIGNPCVPSPCGPNSQCKIIGESPACSCLPNYIGVAPNCRPECSINAECPGNLACQNERCVDPCPGSCGFHAFCTVSNHLARCNCNLGFTGDPFSGCSEIRIPTEAPQNPCNPSPCGANALCKERNGVGSCSCLPEYFGDPYTGCRPECVSNSDCDRNKACLNNKCKDPCPGTCGINAECRVYNHAPNCLCIAGYTGNPLTRCEISQERVNPSQPQDPCAPSPCGPNSLCKIVNGHSVCSCESGYLGTPPSCRPECIVSSECPQNRACINKKCVDPCPNKCGLNARCQVVNHNPICSCSPGYTGNAFSKCLPEAPVINQPVNPCVPSPCGPNSECHVIGDQAACSCLPNYIGRVPNCRKECTIDSECASNAACINERCKDPCQGACGLNALCLPVDHRAICTCQQGFTGDASRSCYQIVISSTEMTPTSSPCTPSPCGPNAECRERNGAGACVCSPNYEGDPYSSQGCRRECEINNDCSPTLSCIRFKCIDPCPGTCGELAQCNVEDHLPICTCPRGYTGDPFFQCKEILLQPTPSPGNPCEPSPCGPNSQCRQSNLQAVCSCLPNYIGSPPACRPECLVNGECDTSKACINQRCEDPCPNTCGLKAQCTVRNHNPICTCPVGMSGDPFTLCYIPQPTSSTERPPTCNPSPCGANSRCQLLTSGPACSCLPDFIGSPPNCRPECNINAECPAALACVNLRCTDPCPGSCGIDAKCHVQNHVAVCVCNEGFAGDPFVRCLPVIEDHTTPEPSDPCNPSPCGPNAQCNNGFCVCLKDYTGNPYESCRPECTGSQECPRDKACFRNKCKDPCPGVCGLNAKCDVINHIPTCSCMADYTGDPFSHCRPAEQPPRDLSNPCVPSPCGPNSQCKNLDNTAACSCLDGFQGAPPSCRPECIVSSECPPSKACVNQKCINPCINACGTLARCEVINHSPICSCNAGQTGDPFKSCYPIPPEDTPRVDACNPSPCGPNAFCNDRNGRADCRCMDNYIGHPPNCRPECVISPDCPPSQACVKNRCIDPCPGSCGVNADCIVVSHTVSCTCRTKYTGNPFLQCYPYEDEVINPCEPSPCGANAICTQRDGAGACSCIDEYQGNPYEGCRPECVLSSDCSTDKSCIRSKCVDPCPGVCGANAECSVINHVPTCACLRGHIGNPFSTCTPEIIPPTEAPITNPCTPSPCGPNSVCRENNGLASCQCLLDYFGAPPDCRPECTVNSECSSDKACHNRKCADPCRGTCGNGAHCQVINHSPLCSCPAGTEGDPFYKCREIIHEPVVTEHRNPCQPNPCGPYSECRAIGDRHSCTCGAGYIGAPPNCRPECVVNTDCPSLLACIAEKCRDPCQGSCGFQAECRVQNHIPTCSCPAGFSGDPFIQCSQAIVPTQPPDLCNPSPCGSNALCDSGSCTCLPAYFGDPYTGCRHECSTNGECSPSLSCQGGKCVDPCPGACGRGAVCNVNNHIPSCACPPSTTGDPFAFCTELKITDEPRSPCAPSPCGPYSECTVSSKGAAACSCRAGHIGSPPSCRPECLVSAECELQLACVDRRCRNPCEGACGRGARCQVVAHSPICTCNQGYTGDPFTACYLQPEQPPAPIDPCQPSPCGPNSRCIVSGESPACSCLPGYIGTPPSCRPECTISAECPATLACVSQKCKNPCLNACGLRATCTAIDHRASCACEPGLIGDPFVGCTAPPEAVPNDPCSPSPCGAGAQCRVRGSLAACECEPGLMGDPYQGCRPECIADSDCAPSRACMRSRCRDPCLGTCGIGALCETVNHIPLCTCPTGTRGDAFTRCERVPLEPTNPCSPSPCGPGALCSATRDSAVCTCPPGTSGEPASTGCRPECVVSSECPRERACVRNKCVDPCPGACGRGAVCRVFDHAPICSCPPPTTGDPFTSCRPKDTEPSVYDACNPNPCGPHGTCRDGVCTYPECVVNDDCSAGRTCHNRKCVDPCVGACGLNAICSTIRHAAVCSCPPGYTGSPFVSCERDKRPPLAQPECERDDQCADDSACVDSRCVPACAAQSCGRNAQCRAIDHRARCTCNPAFEGDARVGCYPTGCRSDNDCPYDESCAGGSCVKVCSRVKCGTLARCVAHAHVPSCECEAGAMGDPWTGCRRSECLSDPECPSWLACRSEKCSDPCPGACAPTARCTVVDHVPGCECPPGFEGNPKIECHTVVQRAECERDADCGPRTACLRGVCKNPCDERACGVGATCRVADTLPLRTLVCECSPPLVGDASIECKPSGACKSDDACADSESCSGGRCVPVCGAGACGRGAECRAEKHRASCTCVPPLQGDASRACYPPPGMVGCTHNSECGAAEACVNKRCEAACWAGACGAGARCDAKDHRALCTCPSGTAGDPAHGCYTPECTSDENCPFDKSCVNKYCVDPCTLGEPCGRGAECTAVAHLASCRCPAGTQGDPRRACVAGACHYDDDCDTTQSCDRLNRVCRPVCSEGTCAPGALCAARNHRPECTCPIGKRGDPYLRGCTITGPPLSTPECTTDSECAAPLGCVNSRCTDLCAPGPCAPGLICRPVDVLPLRGVSCACPDGARVAPDGGCRSPSIAECSSDNDCGNSETCRRGRCVDACRADGCGVNALCEARDHLARCTCAPGYSGNPRIECNAEPKVLNPVIACYTDDECSAERACVERFCVNPCERDNCGIGALCRPINHKAQCSCPRGYTGNPLVRCTPPIDASTIGCKSNSECALSQACVNGLCIDPCACGDKAGCNVVNHHPVCFCQRGFTGDPYTQCVKAGCNSDSECRDSDTCYNGKCISPCLIEATCAINAQCYGKAHRANCRCPAGTVGDAYSRCVPIECSTNTDCDDNSVCLQGSCRKACSTEGQSPCASNAECYARNHAASCQCPPTLPLGDPLSYCHKITPVGEPDCRIDSDCPSGLACLREQCREPCSELKPCAPGARCSVSDSVPFRTLICRCPEGLLPDEGGSCRPAPLPPSGCSSDRDCNSDESCVNRICRNPCNCGTNAECFVRDHRPVCSCRAGYDGDPHRACRIVGCRTDSECASHEACINENCINPCLLNDTCGAYAECFVERNRALCRCRPGFEGVARVGCIAIECRSNGDCPLDKQCRAHRCIDPCLSGDTCGAHAQCLVRGHLAACKCEPGLIGNPYVECRPAPTAECYVDADCPPTSACLSGKCANPCLVLHPCSAPATCEVSPTLPVRTMLCTCPPGYVSNGGGLCRPVAPVVNVACRTDDECPANRACVSSLCIDPCDCGINSDCQIKNHKPVCACKPGFAGNARTGCYELACQSNSQCSDEDSCINGHCVNACSVQRSQCGTSAECYGAQHQASCRCVPGTIGDPYNACRVVGCRTDSECPNDRACLNSLCVNACEAATCAPPSECRVFEHIAHCLCPPGYDATETGCIQKEEPLCRSDVDCPSGRVCISSECVNPCLATKPCGPNAECSVLDTLPVRTMICECLPGFTGNAIEKCVPYQPTKECLPRQALDESGECVPCLAEEGRVVDSRGRCLCDISRGYSLVDGVCRAPGCTSDDECNDRSRCLNGRCVAACEVKRCGVNALCNATNHRASCYCISSYTGDAERYCNPTSNLRTDFPRPEVTVQCMADGVRVVIDIMEQEFNGVLYVRGHSKDEKCRLVTSIPKGSQTTTEIFKVHFGDCGLVHVNGLASFVLVIQKHPKLVTYKAQAYHIKCVYQTGEQNVTLGFNVSMLTTAGTIANTGPPPICSMRIVSRTGDAISSAEIGDNLVLQVEVQPSSIYGGFARSCIAKTTEQSGNVENEYTVTDADGCATDAAIFGDWERSADGDGSTLRAGFNAFKFPSSDNIRFQCNIRVCFGKCQPVNCRGFDAYGKRRKREVIENDTRLATAEGQLREEVTILSNLILTLERREPARISRARESQREAPPAEVCVSAAGLAVALALTALLALVAVAAAVACWLVAWRRARPPPAPLPHPPDFPNPLFQRRSPSD